jgi:RNA-directed DNA polymerase
MYRCLQRQGISRLPELAGDKPTKKWFKSYPISFFHIDIAEVQTAEGKLRLLAAVDRTSKLPSSTRPRARWSRPNSCGT